MKKELKKSKPEYLYGLNPVLASLTANRRQFLKLYLNINEKGNSPKSHPKIEKIYRMATSFGVKPKFMGRNQLSDFTKSRPHQNVVLKVSKLEQINIQRFSDIQVFNSLGKTKAKVGRGKLILFIDGVTDPQNFGSILRSAMFLGVDAIIVNKKDACGLTPTVSKVSSGALEFLPIYSVKFVKDFLADLKKNQDFLIVSTNIDEDGKEILNTEEENNLEEPEEVDSS
mmetsp:Transcript_12725/g.21448  ORF Transcript_12725/g.21448 Transcript_12725/m.21448 type:complete len:227 (+) Transcript_12725:116-796(+)